MLRKNKDIIQPTNNIKIQVKETLENKNVFFIKNLDMDKIFGQMNRNLILYAGEYTYVG